MKDILIKYIEQHPFFGTVTFNNLKEIEEDIENKVNNKFYFDLLKWLDNPSNEDIIEKIKTQYSTTIERNNKKHESELVFNTERELPSLSSLTTYVGMYAEN